MGFSGLIADLPLGDDGLTGTKNLSQIAPTQLIQAEGITYENGTLQKEGGAAKLNSSSVGASVKVIAGSDWIPATDTQRTIIAGDDGKIYRETGDGSFSAIKTGLSLTGEIVPVFVTGGAEAAANNRKLFFISQKNIVQVVDGDASATTDISNPPTDWSGTNQPRTGVIHEDRLWAGGNENDPHRLYYSTASDHEDFIGSGSGTLAVFPGEGEYITQIVSFRGLLIVWKFPVGMFLVDTTSPNIANWKVSRLSNTIGGASAAGASIIEGDVIFMDSSGNFHLVSAVDEFGNLGVNNVSTQTGMDGFIRDEANLSLINKVRSVFYPAKGQAHFSLPRVGTTVNTLRILVDFNIRGRGRFSSSTRDTAECLFLKQDADGIPRITLGDDVGFVYNMDQDGRTKDGGYNGQFQSSHNDMAELDPKLSSVRKAGRFLELVVEPKGNWNLSVDIVWDGTITDTVTYNMGISGATLGTFVFGTDKLTGAELTNKKSRITGSGRRFSLIGRNNGDSQDFSVSKFLLHFFPSNERLD